VSDAFPIVFQLFVTIAYVPKCCFLIGLFFWICFGHYCVVQNLMFQCLLAARSSSQNHVATAVWFRIVFFLVVINSKYELLVPLCDCVATYYVADNHCIDNAWRLVLCCVTTNTDHLLLHFTYNLVASHIPADTSKASIELSLIADGYCCVHTFLL